MSAQPQGKPRNELCHLSWGSLGPTPHSLRDPPTPCAIPPSPCTTLEVAECRSLSRQQTACFVFITTGVHAGRLGPVFCVRGHAWPLFGVFNAPCRIHTDSNLRLTVCQLVSCKPRQRWAFSPAPGALTGSLLTIVLVFPILLKGSIG